MGIFTKKKELTEQERALESFKLQAASHEETAQKWHADYLIVKDLIDQVDQHVADLKAKRAEILANVMDNPINQIENLAYIQQILDAADPIRARLVALASDRKSNEHAARRNAEHLRGRIGVIEQSRKPPSRGVITSGQK